MHRHKDDTVNMVHDIVQINRAIGVSLHISHSLYRDIRRLYQPDRHANIFAHVAIARQQYDSASSGRCLSHDPSHLYIPCHLRLNHFRDQTGRERAAVTFLNRYLLPLNHRFRERPIQPEVRNDIGT